MRADFEQHTMPNGESCFYRERDHSYWKVIEPKNSKPEPTEWKGKERLTGISTCAGGLDFEPDNLMRWAARINMEGVAHLAARALGYQGVTVGDVDWLSRPDAIMRELLRNGLTYDQLRESRATEGTNVHKHALNALASGASVPSYAQLDSTERGYAKGIVQFWLDHSPEPLEAEQVVINLSLGVAGRYDLRCMMGGEVVMLDAKTSGYISLGAHVQLAGYDFCAAGCGIGGSKRAKILQVFEDGRYELIPVRATRQDFVCAVEAYRRSRRIKKEANADRKERES